MDLDKKIGTLIKFRRKEKLMTQQDLANKLGVTYQQILNVHYHLQTY